MRHHFVAITIIIGLGQWAHQLYNRLVTVKGVAESVADDSTAADRHCQASKVQQITTTTTAATAIGQAPITIEQILVSGP